METRQDITEAARAYLASHQEAERAALREELDSYTGDFGEVVEALKPKLPDKPETGWILSREFRASKFAGKHPEQPLTLYVPPDYDPAKAHGLLIWLHGGGQGRGDHGRHFHDNNPAANELFETCGRIVCYPSAPPHDRSWARWQLPEADDYLADVIEELEHFYNIDPNNMVLGGHSMGGMGSYHMSQRFADRFACFLASAGHWDFACWRSLMGTTLWILQGVNDATLFRRRHGTDIEFARLAKLRLDQAGVANAYREHLGSHKLTDAHRILREWVLWSQDKRRDPFHEHVVAVTPRGLTPWSEWRRHKVPLAAHENHTDFHDIPEAPHARWVTIDGVGDETVMFDMIVMSDCRDEVEDDWNDFALTLKRKHLPGGLVEAYIRDDKVIEVTPRNVTGFTLWLHPEMVDLKDVRVLVGGKERFRGELRPSLATLLDSYRRRRDWGMLYPAKVSIEGDGTWETMDQLKITPR